MSGTVTGLDVNRLEELAAAATSGEWAHDRNGIHRRHECVALTYSAEVRPDGRGQSHTDAEFIAEFHNAVPSLLAAARGRDRALALLDEWEAKAGPESSAWEVFGPQKVSVPFALEQIRAALGTEQEGRGE